jgi:hypothetical protein
MLFCSFAKCNSLREVSGAILGLSGKTESFQLSHIPKRITLSDANKNRKVDFFEEIYNKLLQEYGSILSDSRIENVLNKQVKIVDSNPVASASVPLVSTNRYCTKKVCKVKNL